ncbi:MAG: hypothetical protein H0V19_07160 [Euzebyales bacterium]|nr:hypothetical protein [Euzebyales bacterium]
MRSRAFTVVRYCRRRRCGANRIAVDIQNPDNALGGKGTLQQAEADLDPLPFDAASAREFG